MSAQSTAASECPLRVKGGCGRWADGAAGVPPSFGNNPSVAGLTFRAIRNWLETTADQAISGIPRLRPVLAMQPKIVMCQQGKWPCKSPQHVRSGLVQLWLEECARHVPSQNAAATLRKPKNLRPATEAIIHKCG